MHPNAKYKDSVFSLLFSKPDLLRELYSALEGIDLPPDTPVTINTLQDVLFMDKINDISFEIDGKLIVLLEHQSTVNPNIPLRMLMYIARLYEKTIDARNIYATTRITIPRVVFIVLYNGKTEIPDRTTLKLSDMFEQPSPQIATEQETVLELSVKVLNINYGKNGEIAERCRTLAEYSAFVDKVKEFEKETTEREQALKLAIKHCMGHDILKEFLEKHSTEVFNMLMTEWNLDDALAVRYEEGLEIGLEQGREEGWLGGKEEGLEIGLEQGLEQGREEGWLGGKEEGLEEGLEIGQMQMLDLFKKGYTVEEIERQLQAGSLRSKPTSEIGN